MSGLTRSLDADIDGLVEALRRHGFQGARLAVVLGSGLGGVAERLEGRTTVELSELGLAPGRVPGHAGRLHHGRLGGVEALIQEGRVHRYEGWTSRQVARSVRAYARLGALAVVLCNAAGSLRRDWPAGTLVGITDQINLQGGSPLAPEEAGWGNPFDPGLAARIEVAARALGLRFERGVYAGLLGPSYETPAEVRLLASLGADAVGMSTVAESQAARAEGARVAGLSWITNPAAGLAAGALSHEDVVESGREGSSVLAALLEAASQPLSQAI